MNDFKFRVAGYKSHLVHTATVDGADVYVKWADGYKADWNNCLVSTAKNWLKSGDWLKVTGKEEKAQLELENLFSKIKELKKSLTELETAAKKAKLRF